MKRYLTRRVIMPDGSERGLSTVTVADDGTVTVAPFTRETAATSYTDATIRLTPSGKIEFLPSHPDNMA